MNSYSLDKPRTSEMQEFLERMYLIVTSNPEIKFDYNVVYRELMHYGLKGNNLNPDGSLVNIRENFEYWFHKLNNRNHNLNAYSSSGRFSRWAQFNNGFPDDPYIKLYIPMDKDHIKLGVEQLFAFISTLDCIHVSKVDKVLRSDAVVVRVSKNDQDSALKIVDFVNSNPYIKEGLLKPNPFVPSIDGVGWMIDYGRSYNSVIADTVFKYIELVVSQGKKPSIQEFYDLYIYKANYPVPSDISSKDLAKDVKDAFEQACGIQNITFTKTQEDKTAELSEEQKISLFLDSIKETYKNYGIGQAIAAVKAIIYMDNYDLITNGKTNIKYRKALIRYVSKEEAERFIRNSMSIINPESKDYDISKLIEPFINYFFLKDVSLKFSEACMVTLENHGSDWLKNAIYNYIQYDKSQGFSRHISENDNKVNYREEVQKIDNTNCILAMRNFLGAVGVVSNNMSSTELINEYVNILSRSRYSNVENTSKLTA